MLFKPGQCGAANLNSSSVMRDGMSYILFRFLTRGHYDILNIYLELYSILHQVITLEAK